MSVDTDPTKEDVRGLAPLLNASNPKTVVKMFDACADCHYRGPAAAAVSRDQLVESVHASLETESLADAESVVQAITLCLRRAVYNHQPGAAVDPAVVFPSGFHKQLGALVLEILNKRADDWRTLALDNQPSMPRLKDMQWRLNVKTGSDVSAQLNVPAVLVSMELAGSADSQQQPSKTVLFELSKESLQICLDGMSTIRDQLAALSGTATSSNAAPAQRE